MAIAHVGTTADVSRGGGSPVTFTHTTPAGDDRLLIVKIGANSGTVSGVTYGGVALTKLQHFATTVKVEMWYLKSPAVGTSQTVSITWSSSSAAKVCSASSYTGVDQTNTFGTAATGIATSTAPTCTVTSAADEVVVDMVAWQMGSNDPQVTMTAHSGRVQRHNVREGTTLTSTYRGMAGSDAPGAASVTMDWTLSASTAWTMLAVPIKPVVVPPANNVRMIV